MASFGGKITEEERAARRLKFRETYDRDRRAVREGRVIVPLPGTSLELEAQEAARYREVRANLEANGQAAPLGSDDA